MRLALLKVVSGVCALPFLFLVAVPALASWPYLFGSLAIHVAYSLAFAAGAGAAS